MPVRKAAAAAPRINVGAATASVREALRETVNTLDHLAAGDLPGADEALRRGLFQIADARAALSGATIKPLPPELKDWE